MSGLNLTLTAQTVPANSQLPSSAQAMVNFVAQYVGILGGAAFNGINFGASTPAAQNRGLPWFKTDANGNPLGLFSWNGTTWAAIPTIVPSGPTASYPANPANGYEFYDTTIGALVLYNAAAGAWTTASGTVGDIKFVTAGTLAAALAANPGWVQFAAGVGCVLSGAGSATSISAAHTPGQVLGEEAHVLQVSELASHTHGLSLAKGDANGNNYNIDQGVAGYNTPGAAGSATLTTGASGSGAAHNNIQPTIYQYCLVKSF